MPMFPMLLAFFALSLGSYLLLGALDPRRARVASRLSVISQATSRPTDVSLEQPFRRRVLQPIVHAASHWGNWLTPGGQRTRLVDKLVRAGHAQSAALHGVLALKGLGVGASVIGGWGLALSRPSVGIVVGAVGLAASLLGPELAIDRQVRERQGAIVKALPDTLDLITASVEAGLTLDSAIARIAANPNKLQKALFDELTRYLQEIRLGRSRAEALGELGRRCGVADLQSVVAALLQADSLGVGIGTVLRAQSQHLRTRRKQRAQEAAMKAPVKMLFPLVLFVFPSIFIVTLGPAVLKILDMFVK